MLRNARLYRKSEDERKAFYIDEDNGDILFDFLKEDKARAKKFAYILEQILNGRPTRDQYDKENIEKGCEHVYAIKMFKGGQNARIYCQQLSVEGVDSFVIVASELLPKKKTQKLTHKEKAIIRRVANYQYQLRDE